MMSGSASSSSSMTSALSRFSGLIVAERTKARAVQTDKSDRQIWTEGGESRRVHVGLT